MQVSVDLSENQMLYLRRIVDMKKFENINSIEEAIKECINMAMFEEGEISAMQEGM
jgi:hypothetical protein